MNLTEERACAEQYRKHLAGECCGKGAVTMAPKLHWAADMADKTETECGESVYAVLERGEDTTAEPEIEFKFERSACKDCLNEMGLTTTESLTRKED